MLDLLADEVEGHARRKHQIADPRNPVDGTKLMREWDGVEHTVTVLKDGFRLAGPQVQIALGGGPRHHRNALEWLSLLRSA